MRKENDNGLVPGICLLKLPTLPSHCHCASHNLAYNSNKRHPILRSPSLHTVKFSLSSSNVFFPHSHVAPNTVCSWRFAGFPSAACFASMREGTVQRRIHEGGKYCFYYCRSESTKWIDFIIIIIFFFDGTNDHKRATNRMQQNCKSWVRRPFSTMSFPSLHCARVYRKAFDGAKIQ